VSRENVETLKRAMEHLNETGEPDFDLHDNDFVWRTRPADELFAQYRGAESLRRGHQALRGRWTGARIECVDVIGTGDVLVMIVRAHLEPSRDDDESEAIEGWACWLSHGKITRLEQYTSKDEALRAAGLQDLPPHSHEPVAPVRGRSWPRLLGEHHQDLIVGGDCRFFGH
jgi:ketosteroid isomerase-like protein